MNLETFLQKFAEQFTETDANKIKVNTDFKKLSEWSSLIALSVIAMVDEEYSIVLKGNDIRNSKTIEDLYNVIKKQICNP